MTLWRYRAMLTNSTSGEMIAGELAGNSPADVRAALRRIGLQVVDLQPVKRAWSDQRSGLNVIAIARMNFCRHLRHRRISKRAELYDSLATMLESGLQLLESIDTILASTSRRQSSVRTMLTQMREALRSGQSLSHAMQNQPAWFDPSEIAMINAGQHGGSLPAVLRNMTEGHEESRELSGKLVGALAYPAIVAVVGLGVVTFLGVKTLPDLTSILVDAKIEIPPLTARVMQVGQFISNFGLVILLCGVPCLISLSALTRFSGGLRARWLYPKVLRRIAVARLAQQLAKLKQSGVPIVESLRVVAPIGAGLSSDLQRVVSQAADRLERGADLADAFDDDFWFDAEFKRLLEVGQSSGELGELLARIASRYSRQSTRLIERLAAMIEPAAILSLAILVGTVVMAAILPLLRLREVL